MESSGSATFAFQAEIKQLLHLMVHSLYSDREIFLRELISNASDANDRLRFESLGRPELLGADTELTVRVSVEPAARLVTITDNGIGMSRDEVIRLVNVLLVAFQWVPILGGLLLPAMALINYGAYRHAFVLAGERCRHIGTVLLGF